MFPINSWVFLIILAIVVIFFAGKTIVDRREKKKRWHKAISDNIRKQEQDHPIF
jgi:tellurite resistance protein TehA-like permease